MARFFTHKQFIDAYARCILSLRFVEVDEYYHVYRSRYEQTLRRVAKLPLLKGARLVEIGGGQMALLSKDLFGDNATVWDLNAAYAQPLADKGIGFAQFDLLHDPSPPETSAFDALVMCEVVEHMPVPLYTIFEKTMRALKPGGYMVITTPNINRIRNVVHLLSGKDIFCNWDLPERGRGLGHITEFSAERLRWQAERAGLDVLAVEHVQLTLKGSTLATCIGKAMALPLSLRPRWRDGLIMVCQRRA